MKLKEEIKLKEDELNKIRVFVFNEEVLDSIREIVQISHEIRKKEKDLQDKNDNGNKIGRESKSKDQLESLKSKKKVLVEDLYLLQVQEKKKYENILKLEQQNFQVKHWFFSV